MPSKVSLYDLMVGHVVAQARWYHDGDLRPKRHYKGSRKAARPPGRVPWSRIIAIAIHSRRLVMGQAWVYLDLAERIRHDAQRRFRAELAQRKRRVKPMKVSREELAALERIRRRIRATERELAAASGPPPAWTTTARRAVLESDSPIAASSRHQSRMPKPKPPTVIRARVIRPPAGAVFNGVLVTPDQHRLIGDSIEHMAHAGADLHRGDLERLATVVNGRRA